MIVVAAAVIVTSLLIQGTSLPWLLRRLGLRAEDFGTEENKARLKAARAALEWLDDQCHADALMRQPNLRALYMRPRCGACSSALQAVTSPTKPRRWKGIGHCDWS